MEKIVENCGEKRWSAKFGGIIKLKEPSTLPENTYVLINKTQEDSVIRPSTKTRPQLKKSAINFCSLLLSKKIIPKEIERKFLSFAKFGAGMLLARILATCAQILAGRKLGPGLYGQLTIILLLASYFAMPMVNGWGLAFTRVAAQSINERQKCQALKSLLLIVLAASLFTVTALLLLQNIIAAWMDITGPIMQYTIITTIAYSWWMLAKTISQGYQRWNRYIAIEISWSLTILLGLGLITRCNQINIKSASSIFIIGYILPGFFILPTIFKCLHERISKIQLKEIHSHGWFLLLNGLVGVATFSVDRLLINRSLGPIEVGIYQAHFLSTYGIVSAIMTILLTYIFPHFCQDKEGIIHRKISKVSVVQYPVTALFSVATGSIILWAYSYPVSLPLFFSLCFFNCIQFDCQLKMWYMASKGSAESKITLIAQCIFLATNITVLTITIQKINILAGGVSLVAGALASLAYLIQVERTFITHERTI